MKINGASEAFLDLACFSAAGAYLGKHFVTRVNLPISLTPGQFIAGGILNATAIGIGNRLLKDEATPAYRKVLIVVAALAVSTFSAPYMTQAISLKTGVVLTLEAAIAVTALNFACKIVYICLDSLFFGHQAFPKDLEEARKLSIPQVRKLHAQLTRNDKDWKNAPLSIRTVLNKRFKDLDLKTKSYKGFLSAPENQAALDKLEAGEIQFLHETDKPVDIDEDEPLTRQEHTFLNDFFYRKNKLPQTFSYKGDCPESLKKDYLNLQIVSATNAPSVCFEWIVLFQDELTADDEIKNLIATKHTKSIKLDEIDRLRHLNAQEIRSLHIYLGRAENETEWLALPLAVRVILNRHFISSDLNLKKYKYKSFSIVDRSIEELGEKERANLYVDTDQEWFTPCEQMLLNNFFYDHGMPPQTHAGVGGYPNGINVASGTDLSSRSKHDLVWFRTLMDSKEIQAKIDKLLESNSEK